MLTLFRVAATQTGDVDLGSSPTVTPSPGALEAPIAQQHRPSGIRLGRLDLPVSPASPSGHRLPADNGWRLKVAERPTFSPRPCFGVYNAVPPGPPLEEVTRSDVAVDWAVGVGVSFVDHDFEQYLRGQRIQTQRNGGDASIVNSRKCLL